MKSWVTQASKDEGVEAVAVNEDLFVGGRCIIQAKRCSKIVGVEAVHAPAGVMVTTSWVGKASRDFAARTCIWVQIVEAASSSPCSKNTSDSRR